jgi:hypothetical protein
LGQRATVQPADVNKEIAAYKVFMKHAASDPSCGQLII